MASLSDEKTPASIPPPVTTSSTSLTDLKGARPTRFAQFASFLRQAAVICVLIHFTRSWWTGLVKDVSLVGRQSGHDAEGCVEGVSVEVDADELRPLPLVF